jgi:hypothetical protein
VYVFTEGEVTEPEFIEFVTAQGTAHNRAARSSAASRT